MLKSGAKLGPYEILSPLGAGGMGEVYRARDTKLGRDVALKVLPEAFAKDGQRMVRFQREAQVLASLNHPNIAAIYGLEASSGVEALIMELVEGPTLAELLEKTKIESRNSKIGSSFEFRSSSFDPLPIAKQVAEALEYAHERGIVHRDLKPANIKLSHENQVKVLDFGLAKALEGEAAQGPISNSPTLSAMATQAGVILGTAAYMSPEQAKGKAVDRRADIWAFGCVLYEMLSGKQAFAGETVTETLAAVILKEPDWNALPSTTPLGVQKLVRRCVVKEPKQRLQAIGEARIAIEETLSGADARPPLSPLLGEEGKREARGGEIWRRALPWVAATGLLVAAAIFAVLYFRLAHSPSRPIISQILPPPKASFVSDSILTAGPELSPDGTRVLYLAGETGSAPHLWVRSLSSLQAQPLEGTDEATTPFWSPDGKSIGFFSKGKLMKMDASGGAALDLASAPLGRGGSWGTDGTILFAPGINTPIYRISSGGGSPLAVTRFDTSRQESSHRWPQFLPDNQHFLYFSVSALPDQSAIYIGSLTGGSPKLLIRAESNAIYAPPGYLLLMRGGALMAQRFDPDRFELSGDPVEIAEKVSVFGAAWRTIATVSQNGIMAYSTGALPPGRRLEWLDRNGKPVGSIENRDATQDPRISPNGKQLALTVGSLAGNPDIWVYDLERGTKTRLTFSPSIERSPMWSPDGSTIAFASTRNINVHGHHIYEKAADGSGTTQPLLELKEDSWEIPDSWSPDGRYIAYERLASQGRTDFDIWILPLFGDRKPFPFLQSQFNETEAAFSPDGKWLAYTSDESGEQSVYVAPFPKGNGKWQVSPNGGREPRWRRDGKELFYISPDQKMMAVDIRQEASSLKIGNPRPLFQARFSLVPGTVYDVSAEGKKFVVLSPVEQASSEPMTLLVNWPALLQKQ